MKEWLNGWINKSGNRKLMWYVRMSKHDDDDGVEEISWADGLWLSK